MMIFDQLNGSDFSAEFIQEMDEAYFALNVHDSDTLLTFFYFT